jgi:hypothetical protein
MKPATPLTAPARNERESQEAARGRVRYLKLAQALRSAQGGYSAAAMDVTLRHCQAMTEEYQQIMRLMLRPAGPAAPE